MRSLPKDPDTLRIPAFMRKRNLASRARVPLVLTALDRKRAGIPIIEKPKRMARTKKSKTPIRLFTAIEIPQARVKPAPRPKTATEKRIPIKRIQSKTKPHFALPILDASPTIEKKRQRAASIGVMTHYYSKIQVGVIKLTKALSVGDCIMYDEFEQVVESMEINREPVFSAKKADEVGLKLKKEPTVGCTVFRT